MSNSALFSKSRASVYIFSASLSSFLIFYLPMLFAQENIALIFTAHFAGYFIDSLIPAFSAAVVFSEILSAGFARSLLSSFKLALPRLVYLIPYYYLYYMSEGYDTLESLGLLSIRTVFIIVLFALEILAYALLAKLFAKRRAKGWDFFEPSGIFDISAPVGFGVFAICLGKFVMNLITEIKNAVIYFIDYGEFYQMSDVFFALGKILFALATLFASIALIGAVRKRAIKNAEETEEENEEA